MNVQTNNGSFFRFEDLRIYAKSMDYITWLYGAINPIHSEGDDFEKLNFLRDTFLKASQNIAFNIAEGSSRNKTQFQYYLKLAKSSVRESVVFTDLAFRMGLLSAESRECSRVHLMELTKMIGSLIVSLQKGNGNMTRNGKEDEPSNIVPDFDSL